MREQGTSLPPCIILGYIFCPFGCIFGPFGCIFGTFGFIMQFGCHSSLYFGFSFCVRTLSYLPANPNTSKLDPAYPQVCTVHFLERFNRR